MQEFVQAVQSLLGFQLSGAQLSALALYEAELLDWNTRFNLTAIEAPQQVRTKHFLDSLSCLLVMRGSPVGKVIDVGTGAGFPGLPLKIVCPEMRLTLVESVGKKASFCRHAVEKLALKDVEVVVERAETLGQMRAHREAYDWALARAVAIMPVLMELLLPLVRVGGSVLAMKGAAAAAETMSAERAIRVLGGRLKSMTPVKLPGVAEDRYLVVVEKIAATPGGYPRRVGLPAKRPI